MLPTGDLDPEPAANESRSSRWRGPLAFAPLVQPVFRRLWLVWLVANTVMWANDVAAGWLMTSLTDSPLRVALVQAASTLPVFLLGVPSGALADILDRRRWFAATQIWVVLIASLLAFASLSGSLTADSLLFLTFLHGMGLAMRWPVFAAIIPEIVPRAELPAALALNAISMNGSRIIGPILAGALLASLGAPAVFLLNAALSLVATWAVIRWRREVSTPALPAERLLGAIRVGLQYVRQSPPLQAAMWRAALFFIHAVPQLALLPLLARSLPNGGAATYTLLLALMGFGAILAVVLLPRFRDRWSREQLIVRASLLNALAALVVALAPNLWVAAPAMVLAGAGWIGAANTMTVAAQLSLPDWIRARGMAIFQMSMMGGSALGAALWGRVADWAGVHTTLVAAALTGLLTLFLAAQRFRLHEQAPAELEPARDWQAPQPAFPIDSQRGPVMVTIEYQIEAHRIDEFLALMQESRRHRLRNGALAWELVRDSADAGRFVEWYLDESWVGHLRQHERLTEADVLLRAKKHALHVGASTPRVLRLVAQPLEPAVPP
jgi:MFS family permease/quinol monooxygenase YgiN